MDYVVKEIDLADFDLTEVDNPKTEKPGLMALRSE